MTEDPASGRVNVLFVCSQNRWRSPTAEAIYRDHNELSVRSRGTSHNAKRTIGAGDIQWADVIMVMEHKHKQRLQADYPTAMYRKTIHVLDIPDDYRFMDPELIEILRASVDAQLDDGQEA